MLIESERHTKEDLSLWRAYEEGDLINYVAKKVRSKAQNAVSVIKDFDCDYIGVSWGKDSTVVAHLCFAAKVKKPLVWIKVKDIFNPDCEKVRDVFLEKHPMCYEEIEVLRWHDGVRYRATKTLDMGFKKAVEKFGPSYISGIRAQESGIRKLITNKYGHATEKTCRPLAYWTDIDVFAYLAQNKLPVHPAYAMLGGGRYERKHIRVASLAIKRGDNMGKTEWEREYYPDILNRIQAKD
jgi:phosphoadenosine phosphosulfate reductase